MVFAMAALRRIVRLVGGISNLSRRRYASLRRVCSAVSIRSVGKRSRSEVAGIPEHQRRAEKSHLPKDAPNILIILLDDVGFGLADTYGGPIHTPTLSRIANQGISYNAFHTTAICSPTRAALLTGRNHQRVGSGTIAERAVDWDGYAGVISRTSATLAKVLGAYGYKTAAFGKWHNTPAGQRPRRWDRSRSGRPERASASTTSTASWREERLTMGAAADRELQPD